MTETPPQDFQMIKSDYDAGRAAFLEGKDFFEGHPTQETVSDKARSWQRGWLDQCAKAETTTPIHL